VISIEDTPPNIPEYTYIDESILPNPKSNFIKPSHLLCDCSSYQKMIRNDIKTINSSSSSSSLKDDGCCCDGIHCPCFVPNNDVVSNNKKRLRNECSFLCSCYFQSSSSSSSTFSDSDSEQGGFCQNNKFGKFLLRKGRILKKKKKRSKNDEDHNNNKKRTTFMIVWINEIVGWGIISLKTLRKNEIIDEYIGEVSISKHEEEDDSKNKIQDFDLTLSNLMEECKKKEKGI